VFEERARFHQQDGDDGERGEHGDQPCQQQHHFDDPIAHLAIAQLVAGGAGFCCCLCQVRALRSSRRFRSKGRADFNRIAGECASALYPPAASVDKTGGILMDPAR
jgi:hypothetical protein